MAAFQRLNESIIASFKSLKTPCFVLDEEAFLANAKLLKQVQDQTGCKILLAQKAFSNFNLYPLLEPYMAGTEASGLYEARLGKEEMPNKEVHVFSAAYREDEFDALLQYADHIVFNTPHQLKKYGPLAKTMQKSIGLRINPEFSTQDHGMYDPCAPGSRLGTTRKMFDDEMDEASFKLLDGIHFHTLCEQNSDALEMTVDHVLSHWSDVLEKVQWINLGGGHHITRHDYDLETLERCITKIQNQCHLTVYLEPGEAWALNAGYLVTTILDTFQNGDTNIAIMDASPTCHCPDVLEVPYTPPLYQASKGINYRLGGPSCLAGDIMGDYTFKQPLLIGNQLIFGDMALYTTCKTNTFNGMPLPSIYLLTKEKELQCLVQFGFEDFKSRLGK